MKRKKLSTIQFILLLVLFFSILAGALYWGYTSMQRSRDNVSQKLGLLNLYVLEESKLEKLLSEYSEVKIKKSALENAIPSRESLVDFVEQVEMIGEILGLRTTVSLKEGVVDEQGVVVETEAESTRRLTNYSGIKNVEVLEIGVDVKGNLRQIVDFIGMLEEMKYYARVTTIKLGKFEDEKGNVGISGTITLNLFVEPGKK